MATSPSVAARIGQLTVRRVDALTVNLAEVSFIGSSGVRMLLGVLNSEAIASVRLIGVRDNDHVRRVLNLSGARFMLPKHVSVDDTPA